jgi:hypothetical protein
MRANINAGHPRLYVPGHKYEVLMLIITRIISVVFGHESK